MKRIASIFIILSIALMGFADDVVFQANAPKQVHLDLTVIYLCQW